MSAFLLSRYVDLSGLSASQRLHGLVHMTTACEYMYIYIYDKGL